MFEFNRGLRLPAQVTFPLFTANIGRTIECITQVLGPQHGVSQYLDQNPPLPLTDYILRKRYYAFYKSPFDSSRPKGPVYIRPDLVHYPVFQLSALAHEAFHAVDPEMPTLSTTMSKLHSMKPQDPEFAQNNRLCARLQSMREITAINGELQILSGCRVSPHLVPAQIEYFEIQRKAMQANRICMMACEQIRITLLESIEHLVDIHNQISSKVGIHAVSQPYLQILNRCGRELLTFLEENINTSPTHTGKIIKCMEDTEATTTGILSGAGTLGVSSPKSTTLFATWKGALSGAQQMQMANYDLGETRVIPPLVYESWKQPTA